MDDTKTAEPNLWKLARELPYKEHTFSTTAREFTPSFTKKQYPFVLDTVVRLAGIEPARPSAADFKSATSTYSVTVAKS